MVPNFVCVWEGVVLKIWVVQLKMQGYIWKWSSVHALGGVSGVALFITTDEQLE